MAKSPSISESSHDPSPEPQIFGPQNSWLQSSQAQSVWIPRSTDQGIKGWTNWRVEQKPYVSMVDNG